MTVANAAIIVVDAKAGMQVGTELAWEKTENAHMPRMSFVNGMDDPEANLDRVLDQLKEKFGNAIAPFQVPIKEGGKFVGFVNVPTMEGRRFAGNKVENCPIPAGMEEEIEPIRSAILEAVAATDDELMEKFFMEEEFDEHECSDEFYLQLYSGPGCCSS